MGDAYCTGYAGLSEYGWEDVDVLDSSRCEGHDPNWHWERRGETNVGEYEDTGLECCGDDAREYYAGTSNGKSCDTTEACCDNENDVASGGQCVDSCPKAELTCDSQDITLSETPLTTGSPPTITVTVKNIGSCILQLYLIKTLAKFPT